MYVSRALSAPWRNTRKWTFTSFKFSTHFYYLKNYYFVLARVLPDTSMELMRVSRTHGENRQTSIRAVSKELSRRCSPYAAKPGRFATSCAQEIWLHVCHLYRIPVHLGCRIRLQHFENTGKADKRAGGRGGCPVALEHQAWKEKVVTSVIPRMNPTLTLKS